MFQKHGCLITNVLLFPSTSPPPGLCSDARLILPAATILCLSVRQEQAGSLGLIWSEKNPPCHMENMFSLSTQGLPSPQGAAGRNDLKSLSTELRKPEQDLGEALSVVAASVLPFSLPLLVLRSLLGWKTTLGSITRTQLWWEALAEMQPSADFGLGSSQALSEPRPLCLLSLLQSPYSEMPQHKTNHESTSLLVSESREVSTFSPLDGNIEETGREGRGGGRGGQVRSLCIPALECSCRNKDSWDLGDLSQAKRLPSRNNKTHLSSILRKSGVNGVSHLSC